MLQQQKKLLQPKNVAAACCSCLHMPHVRATASRATAAAAVAPKRHLFCKRRRLTFPAWTCCCCCCRCCCCYCCSWPTVGAIMSLTICINLLLRLFLLRLRIDACEPKQKLPLYAILTELSQQISNFICCTLYLSCLNQFFNQFN